MRRAPAERDSSGWWRWLLALLVYGTFAGVIAISLLPVFFLSISIWSEWKHGYCLACMVGDHFEVTSPSREWIAEAREIQCGGPGGSDDDEVALTPASFLRRSFTADRIVYFGGLDFPREAGPNPVAWDGDHRLVINADPCDECHRADAPAGIEVALVPANADP